MTMIKHYINNRWKWDFNGSHAAYDVVSQLTDQYKYDDRCKIHTDLSSQNIGYNNQSKNEVDFFKEY